MIDYINLTRCDNGWTITVTEEPVAPENSSEPVQFPTPRDPIIVEGGDEELLTALAEVLMDYAGEKIPGDENM